MRAAIATPLKTLEPCRHRSCLPAVAAFADISGPPSPRLRRAASACIHARRLVGLSRFELLTPRLSSVCSNQLSYRPKPIQSLGTPKYQRARLEAEFPQNWIERARTIPVNTRSIFRYRRSSRAALGRQDERQL